MGYCGPCVNANVISHRFSLCCIRFFVPSCSVVWSMCEWSKMLLRVLHRSMVWCNLRVNATLHRASLFITQEPLHLLHRGLFIYCTGAFLFITQGPFYLSNRGLFIIQGPLYFSGPPTQHQTQKNHLYCPRVPN